MEKILIWLRQNVFGRASPLLKMREIPLLVLATLGFAGCVASPVPSVHEAALFTSLAGSFVFISAFLAIQLNELAQDYSRVRAGNEIRRIRNWAGDHAQEVFFFGVLMIVMILYCSASVADVKIPGTDESAKLKAAGTLLMLVDTALFVWLARVLAGICIFTAGWLIKEQKLGPAIVCILGALLIGTSPMWVQNIFEISGGGGVFGN